MVVEEGRHGPVCRGRTVTSTGDRWRLGSLALGLLVIMLSGGCGAHDATAPTAAATPTGDAPADTAAAPDTLTSPPGTPPDTANAPSTPISPPVGYSGLPFGPTGLWTLADLNGAPTPFTASQNYINPDSIVQQITAARAIGQRLVLAMASGAEELAANGQFDMARWKHKMDAYNTPAIKDAVNQAVADGTIIGDMLIDEPETRRWGTNLTKGAIDEMAAYAKSLFPTLAVGVNHGPPAYSWRSSERYAVVDYVLYQYAHYITSGNVVAWRDAVLAQAQHDGVTPMLSINVLNGGAQDREGEWDCTGPGQAGKGTYYPNCHMTSAQVREWGKALATYGCFMMLWRYDESYMSNPDNQEAFKEIADLVATAPRRSCNRP